MNQASTISAQLMSRRLLNNQTEKPMARCHGRANATMVPPAIPHRLPIDWKLVDNSTGMMLTTSVGATPGCSRVVPIGVGHS